MEPKKKKKKRKVNKINIFSIILNIFLITLISIITFLILKYDILPLKYLILYFIIFAFIPLLIFFFLLFKKTKFKIKIVLLIFDFIYLIVLGLGTFYLAKTFDFLDVFTKKIDYVTRNYMVLVPNESEYQQIEDLNNKNIGYVEFITANYTNALGELNKTITFQNKNYIDYTTMLEAFRLDEIQALLLTDSYYDILGEEVETFADSYRIIYEFSIQEEADEEIIKDVDVTKDVFNIYISGMDTYGNITNISRSDVNIVISINPKTNQILLVNIPRDYYVVFHDQTNKDKLTHAGLYGTAMSIKTIEDILKIDINYYLKVNYNLLVSLVDTLGGVDVYSKYSFQSGGYYFKEGYNHVDGKLALIFSRTRKVLPNGDIDRGRNQEAMIQAIIKKATSPVILTKYTAILDSLKGSFLTNMSSDKITDIIKMQLDKMPKWNITSMTLTGSGGNDYTSVFPDKKVYVMIPDEETIKDAMEALQAVRDGKILESSYEENTSGDVNTPFHVKPTPKPKDETTEETKDENSSVDSNDAKDEEIIDDETTKPNDTTTETPEDNNNQENSKPELDNNTSTDTSEDNSNSDNSTDNTEPNDILDVPGLVN